ncbi:MAG: hypothetical protein K2N22_05715, partial [Clostridia bacterium]|nr:hypothetical protein [Clostridia bacterium]
MCIPDRRYAVDYAYKGFFEHEISIRKATNFPPYSLICRVMVTSDDKAQALETLKAVYFATEELRAKHPEEFYFLNKMHSPIKKIQGKMRYQVLIRLSGTKLLEEIYDIAVKNTSNSVLVYVEENPVNLS